MNKKTKIGLVLSSAAAILLAGSIMAGGTYALFTSQDSVNIAINSGKVNVSATIDNSDLKTYSGVDLTGDPTTDVVSETSTPGTFTNGGSASISGDTLTLNKMTPGDKVSFNISLTNNTTVKAKYRTVVHTTADDGLFDALSISVGGDTWSSGFSIVSSYTNLEPSATLSSIPIVVDFPSDKGNEYQGMNCSIQFSVEAIQANAAIDDTSTMYLYNERDLINFSKAVNENSDVISSYETFKLASDVTLTKEWSPIGEKDGDKFTKTFDGNNHTISGLNVTTTTAGGTHKNYGAFFGATDTDAVVKNLTVKGTVSCDNAAGVIARMDAGTIENCVSYVTVTGTVKAGGVVCLTNTSGCTVKNCVNYGVVTAPNGESVSVGGIVGFSNANTSITSCNNYANIGSSTETYAGGIVGHSTGSNFSLTDCLNKGDVKGKQYVGGIAAAVALGGSDTNVSITSCVNEGNVVATTDNAGGIVGASNGINDIVTSTNSGSVTANSIDGNAGGVVGNYGKGSITNCKGGTATVVAKYAGRLIGTVVYVKLTIDDTNGDSYEDISTIGNAAITSQGSTEDTSINIVSGTLRGNIAGGQRAIEQTKKTHILVNGENSKWVVDSEERTGVWYPSGDGTWAKEDVA